jgi:fatty-acyl-CoA synthase
MMNYGLTVLRRADRHPEAPAVKYGAKELNNREFAGRVLALAAALKNLGIGRGDVVALLLNNCLEFLETTLAVSLAGGVFLPLNYRLAADEWHYILEHAGAKAILTETSFEPAIDAIDSGLTALAHKVTIGDGHDRWQGYSDLLTAHAAAQLEVAVMGESDLQRLMYTSGTTARPKGVMITHGNHHWKNVAHIVEFGITSADRTLIAGPMYHVGAYDLPATGVFYAGGSLVILPRFDALEVLKACELERPTNVWLAPSMLNAVIQAADGSHDTSSVRFVINGGEKMPAPLIEKVLKTFPKAWFADAYGLTETVSGDTFLDQDHVLSKIGSVGKPVVHLEVRVVDSDDASVAPEGLGEIVLRGPKVFPGYWKDPAGTQAAIRQGWFHTGDIGRIDRDGYLFIEDRKKDLIISGGENIASPEIERVLYEHSAVLEAAVIGVPDDRWGEVPKAFVVLKPGGAANEAELVAFCTQRLARFKVPKSVAFVEALPRNPSGKVLKRELRQLDAATGSDTPHP